MNEKFNKGNKELLIQHAYLNLSFYIRKWYQPEAKCRIWLHGAGCAAYLTNTFCKSNVLEYRLILKIETTKVMGNSYFCHLRKFGPYITWRLFKFVDKPIFNTLQTPPMDLLNYFNISNNMANKNILLNNENDIWTSRLHAKIIGICQIMSMRTSYLYWRIPFSSKYAFVWLCR